MSEFDEYDNDTSTLIERLFASHRSFHGGRNYFILPEDAEKMESADASDAIPRLSISIDLLQTILSHEIESTRNEQVKSKGVTLLVLQSLLQHTNELLQRMDKLEHAVSDDMHRRAIDRSAAIAISAQLDNAQTIVSDQCKMVLELWSGISGEVADLKRDLHYQQARSSVLGGDSEEIVPYVICRIWIDRSSVAQSGENDPEQLDLHAQGEVLQSAVEEFADAFGFTKDCEFPVVSGSWFRTIVLKTKAFFRREDVKRIGREAEYALKAHLIKGELADIDEKKSRAVKNLLEALDQVPQGIIHLESLVVVKTVNLNTEKPIVMVKSLTIEQSIYLENHPELSSDPDKLLYYLKSRGEVPAEGHLSDNRIAGLVADQRQE